MAIGLKHGRNECSESKEESFLLARRFCEIFEKRFGSLLCRELIKCDLLTEEGRRKYVEERVKERKCANFVKETVLILLKLAETEAKL